MYCKHGYYVESAAGHNVCAELEADDAYLAFRALENIHAQMKAEFGPDWKEI